MFVSKKKLKKYIEKLKDDNRANKLGQDYTTPISNDQQFKNMYAQGYEDGTDNFYNALCAHFKIKRGFDNGKS